ncbi:hypothetical protein HRV97_16645 [Sphingomonas sp. HHU CXW]|uniref:HNH endonuclease n=1 Tax=Sphingomonas hominis TaxID=2741495 RepID=A0ABX2JJN0_9SPHN|nr:hypothetical protein [Sphingomonas hominis]NTS66771.1 hypothetical protein [Sphingomonas hominis]
MARYPLLTAFAVAALGSAAVAQDELPDPKVYARAEDRARARLCGVPCSEADVGRGCYRMGERLVREAPCSTYRDGAIHGLATAKCVKMTRPQRFRGIWADHFKAQAFISAGSTPPPWPNGKLPPAEWRAQYDRARAATIWLDVDRDKVPVGWHRAEQRPVIDFIGRKTRYPGHYGHLGMAGHEIVVDRILSLEKCPGAAGCD